MTCYSQRIMTVASRLLGTEFLILNQGQICAHHSSTRWLLQSQTPNFLHHKRNEVKKRGSRLVTAQMFSTSTSLKKDSSTEEEICDKLYRSVEIECRGVDAAVLRSYSQFISAASNHLQVPLDKVEFPKYQLKRYDVLKSAFVHGKHKVQYEIRTHFLIMRFLRLTSSTADTFLEYIQRNLPEGVSMKVTKEELRTLPKYVKGLNVAPQSS